MVTRVLVRSVVLGLLVVASASCARFEWFDWFRHKPEAEAPNNAAPTQRTAKDYEADLRGLVAKRIEAASKITNEQRNRIIKRKPYFFRQYDVYPEGATNLKVVMQEQESRSVPYIADVTVAKRRFATRLHRKRGEAEADAGLLRDTGMETVTYELRNGQWTRTGSLFVAEKSEENVNGEWIPVKETEKRTIAAEEEKSRGFFKRAWRKITLRGEGGQPKEKNEEDKKPRVGTPGGSQNVPGLRRF